MFFSFSVRREPDIGFVFFFFQAEDGIRDYKVTGVQTCALPICRRGPARGTLVHGRRAEVPPHAVEPAQRADRRGPRDRARGGARPRRAADRAASGMDPRAAAPFLSGRSGQKTGEESMSTPFYGWTIVGVGMVVTCVG